MSEQVLQEMDFDDITPAVVPVKLGGKSYELHEADADAVRQWNNAKARGMVFEDGEMKHVDGVADCEILLVSLCLKEVMADGSRKPVGKGFVEAVKRGSVVSQLYRRVVEISELDRDEKPEAIEKQIALLQRRLAKLRKEDPAKNG